MRRLIVTGTMALLLVATLAAVSDGAVRRAEADDNALGNFASICRLSHRLGDDPIVSPGRPGASHSHDFFGNTTTNAWSTYTSLRAGDTNCGRREDRSGYWVPTLSQNGAILDPMAVQAYYNARAKPEVKAPPAGLRVVAGDGKATAPQKITVAAWTCGEDSGVAPSKTPPLCPDGFSLRLEIKFPDCWNGRDLDSPDHKSHLGYSAQGACPSGYPYPLAGLRLSVFYPTRGGSGIALASGSVYSGHADFFNAWDQVELARLTEECLNQHRRCGGRG